MDKNLRVRAAATGGFTLLELMAATTLLVVAIMAIGAIVVPITRQREQVAAKSRVLAVAQGLLEEMKGVAPETIYTTYNNTTHDVADVEGTYTSNRAVLVTVDKTNPTLIVVTVSGSWNIDNHTETLELVTEIYSSAGQM